MNLCIITGKITSKIDFKFIYNPNKKIKKNSNISVCMFRIKINTHTGNNTIEVRGYNEVADLMYRNLKKDDEIILEGEICSDNYINCYYIEKIPYYWENIE